MSAAGRRLLLRGAAAAVVLASGARDAAARDAIDPADRFAFALLGDTPYSRLEELRLQAVFEAIGPDPLACVIHVGDFKAGHESCADDLLERRLRLLDACPHPLVLTPGDNDWTDCHRRGAGGHDPVERLDRLRRLGFAGDESLGRRRIALQRQPGAPENARWRIGTVLFTTLHVVGSNDGLEAYRGSRAEWESRQRLNLAWLRGSIELARQAPTDGMVLAVHADPGFGRRPRPGLAPFRRALLELAREYRGPILFAHGDGHVFRVDEPLRDDDGGPHPHVTRVETFGSPFASSWVKVLWKPGPPHRFVVATRSL